LKVLHLSEYGLPDWRIEKSAITAKREGHDVFFAGQKKKYGYTNKIFNKIYEIEINTIAKYKFPFYYQIVKKKINNIIKEIRPDIIHAHNIFSGKIASELDIPFVFDDHEYSSMHGKLVYEASKILESQNRLISKRFSYFVKKYVKGHLSNLWTEWEKDVVSQYPTITVSEIIAEELKNKYNNNNVLVVPNLPLTDELSHLNNPEYHKEISSVYMGLDGSSVKNYYPNRDMSGLLETFNNNEIGRLDIIGWNDTTKETSKIKFHGYNSRDNLFKILRKSSIGLVPWKKHWSHYYVSPNKTSDYAHSGLLVMCISDLSSISSLLGGNCILFNDYGDLVQKLEYFSENIGEVNKLRLKSFNFAKDNLIWEKYDKNIIYIYNSLV
jgi:glycosyltransferase involved in cell wall biosynthesis